MEVSNIFPDSAAIIIETFFTGLFLFSFDFL